VHENIGFSFAANNFEEANRRTTLRHHERDMANNFDIPPSRNTISTLTDSHGSSTSEVQHSASQERLGVARRFKCPQSGITCLSRNGSSLRMLNYEAAD
jgi:hypothetical protein